MKKILIKTGAMVALSASLAGCVGSNAVTGKLMELNLVAVDNRYARGGLNMLLAPVYGITIIADYVVFNSIGFWTGTNVLNGKPHIFDTKVDTLLEVNDDLDPSLNKAPVPKIPMDPITKVDNSDKSVYSAQLTAVNDNTLDFNIIYTNGEKATLRGEKSGELITFYMDGEFVTTASIDELEAYVAPQV